MKKAPEIVICFKGADEICKFVKEDPRQINDLIEHENLPAWRRNGERVWRALNIDLYHWMIYQRNKYLKNTPKYIKEKTP